MERFALSSVSADKWPKTNDGIDDDDAYNNYNNLDITLAT